METLENYTELTIGKIVAKDYRKAMVFKSHGIDFCCGGNITVEEAVKDQDVSLDQLIDELHKIDAFEEKSEDYTSWSTEKLVAHIVDHHHGYVRKTIEQLTPMLAKVEMVHGNWRPELVEIHQIFKDLSAELLPHLMKEERVLFPAILDLSSQANEGGTCFGSISNPIAAMMHEHDIAGDLIKQIRELSNGFQTPKGACATFIVVYKVLQEFEDDLFTHIHLENNILFPRAQKLEANT